MKHRKLFTFVIFIFGFLAASCDQDPIFYFISTEKRLQTAYIPGTPTKMVEFKRKYTNPLDENDTITVRILYVASGTTLYWYAKSGLLTPDSTGTALKTDGAALWNSPEYGIPQPIKKGKINDIAATTDHLYVLCMNEDRRNVTLWRIGQEDDKWEAVVFDRDAYPFIQTIYADPLTSRLFAGVTQKDSTDYAILYLDDTTNPPELKVLKNNTFMLTGVVSRTDNSELHYYLCTCDIIERSDDIGSSTRGTGIFKIAESALAVSDIGAITSHKDENGKGPEVNKRTKQFMGMIRLEDATNTIIAVERKGGTLYKVENDAFSRMKTGTENDIDITVGSYSTGALALWQNQDASMKILTAGLQTTYSNTSFSNGYVEFEITGGSFTYHNPPSITVNTVNGPEQYSSGLGKRIIKYMFQAPEEIDDDMTFFASTHKDGLWSYRIIDGEPQWNAETNER